MGWMSNCGAINEDAFLSYLASTRLGSEMEACPMTEKCGEWAEMMAADPNQFFADMDCGMDEHHVADEEEEEEEYVALNRSDKKKKKEGK